MFNKIVWATDGSDGADRALAVARTLAADAGGELLVVHCEELVLSSKAGGMLPFHGNEEELKSKIESQVAELSEGGVAAALHIVRAGLGGMARTIADTASDLDGEVIVVGTRGLTPLTGLLLGSVTQRLLHIAPCPVLAVPTVARDESN